MYHSQHYLTIYTLLCLYYWAQSDLFRLRHLLGAHEEAEDEFHLENVLWLGDRAGLKNLLNTVLCINLEITALYM